MGKELTKDQIKQREIVNKINEIIKRYNYNMKIEQDKLEELEKLYSDLEQYIEKYYTSYSDVINALKFNKVFLISGPGGIGKSQFLYEFSEEINERFNYLCIYGKYCENIETSIYNQIKKITQNDRFYFIIDAINELDKTLREEVITFINETLTDYLIARFLMDKIEDLSIREVKSNINEMIKVYYSIQDKIILMLFEKYENNIETAIKIIKETELNDYLNIDIFNETILNDINIKKIQKNFKPNIHIKKLLVNAGGNENNPFNCKNFLNSKLKQIYI